MSASPQLIGKLKFSYEFLSKRNVLAVNGRGFENYRDQEV